MSSNQTIPSPSVVPPLWVPSVHASKISHPSIPTPVRELNFNTWIAPGSGSFSKVTSNSSPGNTSTVTTDVPIGVHPGLSSSETSHKLGAGMSSNQTIPSPSVVPSLWVPSVHSSKISHPSIPSPVMALNFSTWMLASGTSQGVSSKHVRNCSWASAVQMSKYCSSQSGSQKTSMQNGSAAKTCRAISSGFGSVLQSFWDCISQINGASRKGTSHANCCASHRSSGKQFSSSGSHGSSGKQSNPLSVSSGVMSPGPESSSVKVYGPVVSPNSESLDWVSQQPSSTSPAAKFTIELWKVSHGVKLSSSLLGNVGLNTVSAGSSVILGSPEFPHTNVTSNVDVPSVPLKVQKWMSGWSGTTIEPSTTSVSAAIA